MSDNIKPMFEVKAISSSVADDLRKLADAIDAGHYSAETGVVVLTSQANELVTRHSIGQRTTYTAQAMLFKEAHE